MHKDTPKLAGFIFPAGEHLFSSQDICFCWKQNCCSTLVLLGLFLSNLQVGSPVAPCSTASHTSLLLAPALLPTPCTLLQCIGSGWEFLPAQTTLAPISGSNPMHPAHFCSKDAHNPAQRLQLLCRFQYLLCSFSSRLQPGRMLRSPEQHWPCQTADSRFSPW